MASGLSIWSCVLLNALCVKNQFVSMCHWCDICCVEKKGIVSYS
uniref:Uncharacterized protein n=1 Tax=Anguilla anguilla TaxID=7936 RepID=A0A0E9SQU1_ANGAN